ncbi:MAG TPA: indolepyruvate ferredoxin oxidoreductase family protein [Euzebyales bacterium]
MTDLSDYRLEDRYVRAEGRVFLTGIQALARIPFEQLRRDRAVGRNTAALASGYPGSPLGGFDQELARAIRQVPDLPVVHRPAVNEELGATAVMGSQLVATRPDATYDGVVGIWYGKAPGLDRATDALRHGGFAGSSAGGGALALVGDDPSAKSSTMPSSSDAALIDLHMPILYPGTIAECLELGLHGIAMSRATGLWSALKIVTPIADGTGSVDLPVLDQELSIPTTEIDGERWSPMPSAQFLGPRMVAVEQEFHEVRWPLAYRYGVDNGLNRVTADPTDAWIGLVATGYTYYQVLDALRRLGFDNLDAIADAGIRLLHLRLPVPFDTALIADFARDVDEIVVVEEKNPTLERLIRDALYDTTVRPRVLGKHDTDGARLLPTYGHLNADVIAPALRRRLAPRLADRLPPPPPPPRELLPLATGRTPFFCSGCPHNWGVKVPDGAVVGAGTGCHGMTLLMDEDRVGESIGITAMGNEGAQWIGMEPFVNTGHIFQNVGDGTFFHSGQLAIQAAVGAGVHMTFKILYNDTVAMTGGQDATHSIGVPDLARVLLGHGVTEVLITTDDADRYDRSGLPDGVQVWDRTRIVEAQQHLAARPGVTVLIHDQECAAELRRARRRGRVETPDTRVVINHRICEGCGDCGDVSNCLSVQPLDTPLGRKTRIDQLSCNFDWSCLKGDCPAFMTVAVDPAAEPRDRHPDPTQVPVDDPASSDADSVAVRLAGIGGTGVVTAAQVLGTAAMLAGWSVDGVDQTGLSQKAGPVISDLTFSRGTSRRSNAIGTGQADVIIAFDQLVAAADGVVAAGASGRTVVVAATRETPTGAMIGKPETPYPTPERLAARLTGRGDDDRYTALDAATLADSLTGAAAAANILLLGVAVQQGVVPVPPAAVERAIELNGVAVEANKAAFEWGRRWVADPRAVERIAGSRADGAPQVRTVALPRRLRARVIGLGLDDAATEAVSMLAADLVGYQNAVYAARFLDLVEVARNSERRVGLDDQRFSVAVARGHHKLLAYKDEYEVARLMLSDDGLAEAQRVAGRPDAAISWHLHPPMLKALGVDRKLRFDGRTAPLFAALGAGKRLRGTRFDPFGRTRMRRLERALPVEYADAIMRVARVLTTGNVESAIAIAELPDMVRGFEELKLRRAAAYRQQLAAAVDDLERDLGAPDHT